MFRRLRQCQQGFVLEQLADIGSVAADDHVDAFIVEDLLELIGFLVVNPERANAYHTQWKDDRINELYALERRTLEGEERGKMFKEI